MLCSSANLLSRAVWYELVPDCLVHSKTEGYSPSSCGWWLWNATENKVNLLQTCKCENEPLGTQNGFGNEGLPGERREEIALQS